MRGWMFVIGLACMGMLSSAQAATDLHFVDLNGKKVKLSDYKGKWVVVNYWATWCPPCVKEIPELQSFHEAHAAKDAVVLGINQEDGSITEVKQFADSMMVSYPVVRGEGVLSNNTPFGTLRGLPTTFMITPKGELVAARTGMVNQQSLEKFIQDYKD